MPASGVRYEASIQAFENDEIKNLLSVCAYGGMPIQIGFCWGYNTKLNCLEYHGSSEINIGVDEFILLLAKQEEIENGTLDTSVVKAFHVPAGVAVEIYATTLHYAPCHCDSNKGFRVAIVLPKGTNLEKRVSPVLNDEAKHMTACNKWLLAHPDSVEASDPAVIGLTGKILDVFSD